MAIEITKIDSTTKAGIRSALEAASFSDLAPITGVYTTVNTYSANWQAGALGSVNRIIAGTNVQVTPALGTGVVTINVAGNNWNSVYTSFNTNSAKYDSAYTSFNTNSGNYSSTYTTVSTLSTSWLYGALDLTTLQTYLSNNNVLIQTATVINTLSVGNNSGIIANSVTTKGAGTPTLSSNSDLTLAALQRVTVLKTPLRLYNTTTASRDTGILVPLNGDLIYNTTLSGIEFYDGKNWINSRAYDLTIAYLASISAISILSGGNAFGNNVVIGTNDDFGLNLKTANSNRVVILSTGEVTINAVLQNLSANRNALDVRGTMTVYSEISALTAFSALSGSSPGQFSAGGMLIGQNEGGAYFGRVGVRENSWQVLSGTGGVNWVSRATNTSWNDVAMSSDGRIIAATSGGSPKIWTSYDYGATWIQRFSVSQSCIGIAMSSDGRIQTAVAGNGNIWTSYDYGVTWTSRATARFWAGIAMSSDGRIQTATVQSGGNIWTSYDYGATWVSRASIQDWYGIAMSSDGRIQTAVSSDNGICTSYDYGVTWSSSAAASLNWRDISISSDGRIQTAVVRNGGDIWTSYDYGVTWISRATTQSWLSVTMSSDGRIQTAVVLNGNIWASDDYGVTWTSRATARFWVGIAMSSDGRIQAAVPSSGNIWISYATTITPNPITVLGTISATGVIYASGGNSNQWNSAYTTICAVSAGWTSVSVISTDSLLLTIDSSNYNTYQNQILHTRNTSPARINFEQSLPAGFNMMVLNDSTENVTLTSSTSNVFFGYGSTLSGSQGTKQFYTTATVYKYGTRVYAVGSLI